jgi:SAM-dependent methyltransferase
MTISERDNAIARLRPWVERARSFSGWSFNDVDPERLGPDRPWSYKTRARELLSHSRSVVDLGTGGGERFADVLEAFQGRAVATEEWDVNAPIAAARLGPLSVGVVRCSSLVLPVADSSFDLVLDRHEALEPAEIGRVLRTSGTVLTQQVQDHNWHELRQFFPRMTIFDPHFRLYQEGFRAAGLTVNDARTHDAPVAYRGLGELVYMLCVTPLTIPGFDSLGADLEALLALELALTTSDGIVVTESRYIIEARKAGLRQG